MDAEQLFRNIRDIKVEMARLDQRADYIRSSMLPSAIRYDKDNVMSSPEDPMGKFAERLSDLEESTKARLDELIKYNLLAEKILSEMPTAKYRLLLQLRYIDGGYDHRNSWSEVAMIMNYEEWYVSHDLHRAAMEEAQEIYEKYNI